MNPQALAEQLVRQVLANDEDGATETFAILVGELSDHDPNIIAWRAIDIKEAFRKVWKEREQREQAKRHPFGMASTGSER